MKSLAGTLGKRCCTIAGIEGLTPPVARQLPPQKGTSVSCMLVSTLLPGGVGGKESNGRRLKYRQ